MELNVDQLIKIMPAAKSKAATFLPYINATMKEFSIDSNVLRIAAFIAQIGHESGSLVYVKELASGTAYEGRKDLGNTSPGDGVKYKGRGLIQITGKANYEAIAKDLNIDCVNHPELLETPQNACRTAGWFWNRTKLSPLADSGTVDDYTKITRKINGGINGLSDRIALWVKAKQVLDAVVAKK